MSTRTPGRFVAENEPLVVRLELPGQRLVALKSRVEALEAQTVKLREAEAATKDGEDTNNMMFLELGGEH